MTKLLLLFFVGCFVSFGQAEKPVDYTGYKVISISPNKDSHVQLIRRLKNEYKVDLWHEQMGINGSVMMSLNPNLAHTVLQMLSDEKVEHSVVFHNLQSVIDEERKVAFAPGHPSQKAGFFNFGAYNRLENIEALLKDLSQTYPNVAKLDVVGQSYENRNIYALRISGGGQFGTKPAIMMECGIHAREWSSVAAGVYLVNKLITEYGKDPTVTALVDKYEFVVIPESNPDGYVYSYTSDRMWRKTRSHSSRDWTRTCRGADANRNFDIQHCGVGTSQQPCEDIYCGDAPFSESESRTLRDLMVELKSRMKAYFSIHAYSQLWMTPYGISKQAPPNYSELMRVGNAGAAALRKKYGTLYSVGSIANIIYEAAGSSVDYAYVTHGIKMAFALELRDKGTHGFFLPAYQILPTCEETFDGLMGAILAMN